MNQRFSSLTAAAATLFLVVVIGLFGPAVGKTCWARTLPWSSAGTIPTTDAAEYASLTFRPLARAGHSVVYASARGRLVCFGGRAQSEGKRLGDTWEWDGLRWLQVQTFDGPQPRSRHSMAYDPVRDVVVLFGGADRSDLPMGDTWEFDGTDWKQRLSNQSPAPRQFASMAWDPSSGRVLLFGGQNEQGLLLSDTWSWNGHLWERLVPSFFPSARYLHSICQDRNRSEVVLFGGVDSTGSVLGDTWVWTGVNWQQKSPAVRPPARYGAATTYDPIHSRMLLAAGATGSSSLPYLADLWSWDGRDWVSLADSIPPGTRFGHAMSFDSVRDRLLLFGGSGGEGGHLGDLWEWDSTAWSLETGTGSPPAADRVNLTAATFDIGRDQLVLLTSRSGENQFGNDTWDWTGSHWSMLFPTSAPAVHRGSLAYDTARGRSLLFGGAFLNGFAPTDTWSFDGVDWTTLPTTINPRGRTDSAMTYDQARRKVVLFGGRSQGSILDDTWEWDGSDWTARSASSVPDGRSHAGLAYDSCRGKSVLFGGFGGFEGIETLNSTWEWNGTVWQRVHSSVSPPARARPGMAFDPIRCRILLFGGSQVIEDLGDTWEFDGLSWTELHPATSPSARDGHSLSYDPVRRRMLLFGGRAAFGPALRDTWAWDGSDWSLLDSGSNAYPKPIQSSLPPRLGVTISPDFPKLGQSVLLQANELDFGGGSLTSEAWLQTAGPAVPSDTSRSRSLQLTPTLPGEYAFQVAFGDGQGGYSFGAAAFRVRPPESDDQRLRSGINLVSVPFDPSRAGRRFTIDDLRREAAAVAIGSARPEGIFSIRLAEESSSPPSVTSTAGYLLFMNRAGDAYSVDGRDWLPFGSPRVLFDLRSGLNLIGVPGSLPRTLTAKTFSDATGARFVARQSSAPGRRSFDSYVPGLSSDFPLKPGRGYIVSLPKPVFASLPVNHSPVVSLRVLSRQLARQPVIIEANVSDEDAEDVSYSWFLNVPAELFDSPQDPQSDRIRFTPPLPGSYSVGLGVTDSGGAFASSTVQLTVAAANAAPSVVVTGPADATPNVLLTLVASASDPDGDPLIYTWRRLVGSATIEPNLRKASLNLAPTTTGILSFQLTANDQRGGLARAVHVLQVGFRNSAPTASILPVTTASVGQLVTLTGEGTDPDSDPLLYTWTQQIGAASLTLNDPTGTTVSFVVPLPGHYTLRLIVTDVHGALGSDTATVFVNDVPTSSAGPDQIVTAGSRVTLSGSGSDFETGPLSYVWDQQSGPTSLELGDVSSPSISFTTSATGIYSMRLSVTDEHGASDSDLVTIRINGVPSAEAGERQVVSAGVTVILSGSGSDPEGSSVTYRWDQIGGPSTLVLSSASSPNATFVTSVLGIYSLQLTVTDTLSAVGSDTTTVEIAAPSRFWKAEVIDSFRAGRSHSMGTLGTGEPVLAYISGQETTSVLRFAQRESGVWKTELVTSSHNGQSIDKFARIGVGPGDALAAYSYPAVQRSLVALRSSPGTWKLTSPHGSSVSGGEYGSIAIGSDGVLRICSYLRTDGSTNPNALEYAELRNGTWIRELADHSSADVGTKTSMVLDASNRPHVTYFDSAAGGVKYALRTAAGVWTTEVVTGTSPSIGGVTAVALDSSGNPCVAFTTGDGRGVFFAKRVATSWVVQEVDSGQFSGLSLVIDIQDKPLLAFQVDAPVPGEIRLARTDGGGWTIETVLTGPNWTRDFFLEEEVTLVLDSQGAPRLSAHQTGFGGLLLYLTSTSGPVNQPPVPSTATSLAGSVGSELQLSATATDSDQDQVFFQWTLTSGPSPVEFGSSTSPTTRFVPGASGEYTIQLAVTDGTAIATVEVLVSVP